LSPKLKYLSCSNNLLTELPVLPPDLESLHCGENRLVRLPHLPNKLIRFDFPCNQVSVLPKLSPNLQILDCSNNDLQILPMEIGRIGHVIYHANPFYEIVRPVVTKKELMLKLETLHRFRVSYYCAKYKSQLRDWLWNLRDRRIRDAYHPDKLVELLSRMVNPDDEEEFERMMNWFHSDERWR